MKDIKCPQYCFKMKADFALKKTKDLKNKWQEQYFILGIIISAILNTCGGIFSVLSLKTVTQDVIDHWSNSLPSQMAFIPPWVYRICLSFQATQEAITQQQAVMIICKKSPRLITYNTHMFIRNPEGSSRLADSDTVLAVLSRGYHVPSTSTFTVASAYTYGEKLPPEDKHLEYKHWSTTTVQGIVSKVKDNRTTKGLFSLANNAEMGHFIIGVQDEDCCAKGVLMTEAEQLEFRRHLTEWLLKDDEGNDRIWGEEGRIPAAGTDWDVSFVPVTGCPDNMTTRVLIVIKMYSCLGGMFERHPECYMLTDTGEVCRLPFQEWKEKITQDSDMITSLTGSTNPITTNSAAHLVPPVTATVSPVTTVPTSSFVPTVSLVASISSSTTTPHVTSTTAPVASATSYVASATPYVACATPSVASVTPSAASVGMIVASSTPPESANSYESAQWTKCADWTSYISEVNEDILDTGIAGLQSSKMEMRKGVNWIPSRQSLCQRFPSSQDHISKILTMIEHECGPVPACAISFASFSDSFEHQAPITKPAGHILDTLLILQSNLVQLWSCLDTRGNDVQQHGQRQYAYELNRVFKKNTLLQPMITCPFNPVSFHIEPVLYYSDTNHSITLPLHVDVVSQSSMWLHHMAGVNLELVRSAIVSLLIVRNVSIQDRVGRNRHLKTAPERDLITHDVRDFPGNPN